MLATMISLKSTNNPSKSAANLHSSNTNESQEAHINVSSPGEPSHAPGNTKSNPSGPSEETHDCDLDMATSEGEGEEDDVGASEAYLIYSFTGPKSVQVKTAAFADVPEEGFQDGETPAPSAPGATAPVPAPHNGAFSSVSTPVYGEAFWVGEEDTPLELKPPSPRTLRYASVTRTGTSGPAIVAISSGAPQNVPNASGATQRRITLSKNGNILLISNNHNKPSNVVASNVNLVPTANTSPSKVVAESSVVDLTESGGEENSVKSTVRRSVTLVAPGGGGSEPGTIKLHSTGSSQNFISYRARLLNSRTMRCPTCGRHYRNAYSLSHHICSPRKTVWRRGDVACHIIDGQQIYFCPICDRPFKWLGNLTRHYYVHTGQRFFKCEMCSKEFFSSYQVKRHMNSHTGLRYKCEICDKPFTCKYACSWHTRQHRSPNTNASSHNPAMMKGASASLATDRDTHHHHGPLSSGKLSSASTAM